MKKIDIKRDVNGVPTWGISFSANRFQGILLSGAEQTLTVPKSPYSDYPNVIAIFSFASGSSIWVSVNQTCTLPTGSIASSSSELNPAPRIFDAGDVLHFKTNDTSDEYGVTFYAC